MKKKMIQTLLFYTFKLGILGSLYAQYSEVNNSNWFPFTPSSTPVAGVIGMQSWLDAPAGKHGFVQSVDDKLVFENGRPVKFWGTNICSAVPFTDSLRANAFVEFLAKYGVNSVRFHKFSWYGYHPDRSTDLDPLKFARLDYFQSHCVKREFITGGRIFMATVCQRETVVD
jgi:hypothetical protein